MLYGGFECGFLFLLQHPRVRYAACNAIGQMATDFAPTFQKKFHDKVCEEEGLHQVEGESQQACDIKASFSFLAGDFGPASDHGGPE